MVREFSRAYGALGGHDHLGHALQPEPGVLPAGGHPGAGQGSPTRLYLVSYPGDGTTIARTWISQGGVKKFLLNDGMNAPSSSRTSGPSTSTTPTARRRGRRRRRPPSTSPASTRLLEVRRRRPRRRPLLRRRGHPGPGHRPGRQGGVGGDPRRHPQGARPQGRRRSTPAPPSSARRFGPHQGGQADPLRRRDRPRPVRPVRRHHRALPPVAHPGRAGGRRPARCPAADVDALKARLPQ